MLASPEPVGGCALEAVAERGVLLGGSTGDSRTETTRLSSRGGWDRIRGEFAKDASGLVSYPDSHVHPPIFLVVLSQHVRKTGKPIRTLV